LAEVDVGALADFPPGAVKIVREGDLAVGVFNAERCIVVCPRHGSEFDLRTGKPRTLPAYLPVPTYPVRVEHGRIVVVLP
jgi:3-phenylpropionate/trans-cinnamate dioxygenase ferredoxin subunit